MSNTDRIRAYYNLHRKCFSVQDYKTGLVIEHTDKLFVTNAMFVVRKSGNERVKQEGKKNVHAFVNGIRSKLKQGMMPEFASYKVRYDPYTMDYFHYQRDVNNKLVWLPVDKHWIGNVTLNIINDKPIMYADIDKLGDTKNDKSNDTNNGKLGDTRYTMPIKILKFHIKGSLMKNGGFSMEFLKRKKNMKIKIK